MFSATMPPKINQLAKSILKSPVEVSVALSKPPESILQQAYIVYEGQKIPLVRNILSCKSHQSILIFCSKKQTVKQLTQQLQKLGFNAMDIHSDLEQNQREEVLLSFSSKRLPILIATDILSRGIDIDQIDLVINYDVPSDGEDYVHRIGRTARAETKGTAITLVNQEDQFKFKRIEKLIGKVVDKMPIPPELGEGPSYEDSKKPIQKQMGGFEKRKQSKTNKKDAAEGVRKQITISKKNSTS
jgi:superfamily II DNA/RNA helicase